MKIDVSKPLTLGAKRTLKAFRIAMFESLSESEFDKITVNDICQRSEYPRATFYNYFDDKLDLLQYLWSYLTKDILKQLPVKQDKPEFIEVFNLLLKFFRKNPALLENLRKSHGAESHLWHNLAGYVKHEATDIVYQNRLKTDCINVPTKLVARFYSDLIIGMLEWCLFEEPETDIETADVYLKDLVNKQF